MPSIRQNNRAATLLADIRDEDRLSLERLALLVGVRVDALQACRDHKLALAPDVQVRVARTIGARIPRLAARARRLEEQAAAAASFEGGANATHLTAPAKWR